ncbi:hypothetical protein [Ruegeria arenilitoris]|uniref:hypothetical protein n=1 Tax=Ruegeria arenilitoris TaxID=1173585 RepID=UPI0020C52EDA|nr:hypothetical protein [Ruegeria arenilitoris]
MKRLFPSLPDNATLGSVYQAFPDKLAPLCAYESLVMRGESDLSVADRELIAASNNRSAPSSSITTTVATTKAWAT